MYFHAYYCILVKVTVSSFRFMCNLLLHRLVAPISKQYSVQICEICIRQTFVSIHHHFPGSGCRQGRWHRLGAARLATPGSVVRLTTQGAQRPRAEQYLSNENDGVHKNPAPPRVPHRS